MSAEVASAFVASRLLARRTAGGRCLIYISLSERRATEIARLLGAMAPKARAVIFPAWDCLPYDRASPSAEVMGARMSALRLMARGDIGVMLATPEALIQRTPPRPVIEADPLVLRVGDAFDPEPLQQQLHRLGYRHGDQVQEPGEYALRGEVLDVFAAAEARPHRLDFAEGRITAVRAFDPVTQRSAETVEAVALGPASEAVFTNEFF